MPEINVTWFSKSLSFPFNDEQFTLVHATSFVIRTSTNVTDVSMYPPP